MAHGFFRMFGVFMIVSVYLGAVDGQSITQVNKETFLDGVKIADDSYAKITVDSFVENGTVMYEIKKTKFNETEPEVERIPAKDNTLKEVHMVIENGPNGSSSIMQSSSYNTLSQWTNGNPISLPPLPPIQVPAIKLPHLHIPTIHIPKIPDFKLPAIAVPDLSKIFEKCFPFCNTPFFSHSQENNE